MSASLYFFDDLATPTALPILLGHFEMHCHMHFALPIMKEAKTFFTVLAVTKLTFHSLGCIERARTFRLLAWFKVRISNNLLVAVYFMNFSLKTARK